MTFLDVPGIFELDNDGDFLSRRHVIVRLDFERWGKGVEVPFKLT
jgi:hypothetical protein